MISWVRNFSPPIIWFFIILYLLFAFEPSEGSGNIPFSDKLAHAILFGVLTVLAMHAVFKQFIFFNKKSIIKIILILNLAYAGITEIVQHLFIENRNGELNDFYADAIGIILGYLSLLLAIKYLPYRFKKILMVI